MDQKAWIEIVGQAEHYKAIGKTEIFLCDDDASLYPWGFVNGMRDGGGRRLGAATSVHFSASHPSGLTFSWIFDLERREANGRGYFNVNKDGCATVMSVLPKVMKGLFGEYLVRCAAKIRANAAEYQEIADRERRIAQDLESMAQK